MSLKEALLYMKTENNRVSCFLCHHHCRISEGEFGFCNVRENKAGSLFTHSYGELIAANVDPIEKKPLYHFLPGTSSYSIAAIGCNFRCGFCQNWQISQAREAQDLGLLPWPAAPQEIVSLARQTGSKSISYTYTEPTIYFEYAFETARLARNAGLFNVFVTNGYMTREMIEMIVPHLDAANIDLKFFNDETYKKVCRGRLSPVLQNIELLKKSGIWIEVTTLIVPGLNDSGGELQDIASFLSGIDVSIPWHISRFHPQFHMTDRPSTSISVLNMAYEIASRAGLRHVYLGNVMGEGNNTYCWRCRKLLIERSGFSVLKNELKEGMCPHCGTPLEGIGI